jgi:hypothetical protein
MKGREVLLLLSSHIHIQDWGQTHAFFHSLRHHRDIKHIWINFFVIHCEVEHSRPLAHFHTGFRLDIHKLYNINSNYVC